MKRNPLTSKVKIIDILKYKDYRKFLMDFLEAKRLEKSWFSIRYFANKVEMDHGNLNRILHNQRELPIKNIPIFQKVLKLDGRRAEYFRLLVLYKRAKTPDEADSYLNKLLSFSGNIKQRKLEENQYKFYSTWYHNAIYLLIGIDGFDEDYEKLARQLTPKIRASQTKSSVKLLLNLGLLERNTSGKLIQSSKVLTTGDEWRSSIIHNYQKNTLEMALNSLELHPKEVRDLSTMSVSIDSKDLEQIREVLKKARAEISRIAQNSDPVDSVYHVNMQIFPMAFVNDENGTSTKSANKESGTSPESTIEENSETEKKAKVTEKKKSSIKKDES